MKHIHNRSLLQGQFNSIAKKRERRNSQFDRPSIGSVDIGVEEFSSAPSYDQGALTSILHTMNPSGRHIKHQSQITMHASPTQNLDIKGDLTQRIDNSYTGIKSSRFSMRESKKANISQPTTGIRNARGKSPICSTNNSSQVTKLAAPTLYNGQRTIGLLDSQFSTQRHDQNIKSSKKQTYSIPLHHQSPATADIAAMA